MTWHGESCKQVLSRFSRCTHSSSIKMPPESHWWISVLSISMFHDQKCESRDQSRCWGWWVFIDSSSASNHRSLTYTDCVQVQLHHKNRISLQLWGHLQKTKHLLCLFYTGLSTARDPGPNHKDTCEHRHALCECWWQTCRADGRVPELMFM